MPYKQEGLQLAAGKKLLIVVIILFSDLILISSQIILKDHRTLLHYVLANISAPFQLAFHKVTSAVGSGVRHYVLLKNSYEKYEALREEHSRLKYENYLLKQELGDVRSLIQVRQRLNRFVMADVISIDINFPYSTLVINRGRNHGIQEKMVVLNENCELVGRIIHPVSAFTSGVRLITNSTGGTGAYVGTNRLEGLLSGTNSAECYFKYLMENKPTYVGDAVYTSGTDCIYPPFIPIGTVVRIEKDDLMQKIIVKPFFIGRPLKRLIVIPHEPTS